MLQICRELVPAGVGDRPVVGRHGRPRALFTVGAEEAARNLGVIGQIARSERLLRGRALEPRQPVRDVVREARLAHLAVADDVDPRGDLPVDGLVHRRAHALGGADSR